MRSGQADLLRAPDLLRSTSYISAIFHTERSLVPTGLLHVVRNKTPRRALPTRPNDFQQGLTNNRCQIDRLCPSRRCLDVRQKVRAYTETLTGTRPQ